LSSNPPPAASSTSVQPGHFALEQQRLRSESGGLLAFALEHCERHSSIELLLRGWVLDPGALLQCITVVQGTKRVPILDDAFWHLRPRLVDAFQEAFQAAKLPLASEARPGFISGLTLAEPLSPSATSLTIEVSLRDGTVQQYSAQLTGLPEPVAAKPPQHRLLRNHQHQVAALAIERCERAGDALLVLRGWILDPAQQLQQLHLVVGDTRIPVLTDALRHPRPDLLKTFRPTFEAAGQTLDPVLAPAFSTRLELTQPIPDAPSLEFESVLADGSVRRFWSALSSSPSEAPIHTHRLLHARNGSLAALAVEQCERAGDALLVLRGWILDPAQQLQQLHLVVGDTRIPVLTDALRHPRPDLLKTFRPTFEAAGHAIPQESANGFLALLEAGGVEQGECKLEALLIDQSGRSFVQKWTSPRSLDAGVQLSALTELLNKFSDERFDPEWLSVAFARARWPQLQPKIARWLDLGVRLLPDWAAQLEVQLPESSQLGGVLKLEISQAILLWDRSLFTSGWAMDARGDITGLHLVLPNSQTVNLLRQPTTVRISHPDLYKSHLRTYGLRDAHFGFATWLRDLDLGSATKFSLIVAVDHKPIARTTIEARRLPNQAIVQVEEVLSAFPNRLFEPRSLLDTCFGPCVQSIWRKHATATPTITRETFGPRPERPVVSLIIPIYGRWDFIEYQLVQFRKDTLLCASEILYVIDDPSIFDRVREYCRDLHLILDVPFQLVFGHGNLGYAGANNLGAHAASGQYLLLMNSDVLPEQPGWLDALLKLHELTPDAGAISPVLLYEDGSLQHAGMRFRRLPAWQGLWINEHPGKGLPPQAKGQGKSLTAVQAVTGACLLVRAHTYRHLGGFDTAYIRGDFEDSDFCMRLKRMGLQCYVAADVRLFHLERLSQSLGAHALIRRNLTLYNAWLHSQRWDEAIQALGEPPT
jgi:GT2 family glycosyltransferase